MMGNHQHKYSGLSWATLLAVAALLNACGGGDSRDGLMPQTAAISGPALYVQASAMSGGDGSLRSPFTSLEALEAASKPGDTLVIMPAPLDVPPLDGGIQLKPGQKLIGGGPSVLRQPNSAAVAGAAELTSLPRIRNSSLLRLDGDAVRLAEGAEVRNLVITDAMRGAIYGLNVPGVVIEGNDVSGYNPLCLIGFMVEPFPAPSSFPQGSAPLLLPAGWAGIMVDADTGSGTITINNNYVHDSACGNGIDVRIHGDADYSAEISGNFITELKHGPLYQAQELHLVHAITTQVTDDARLEANSVNNTQTFIGAPGADCEGLFMNIADSGTAIWHIDRNYFAHGIGGFSCNGMEFIISNGNGYGEMHISNSHFEDNEGDMFEQANLGSGSTAILELHNVVAKNTHERGGDPDSGYIPFNLGECLLTGSTGTGNTTILKIRDTEFSGCNNGLSILSGANLMTNLLGAITTMQLPTDPLGPDSLMSVEISNSRFVDNAFNNIVVGVINNLTDLQLKVENSDFSHAGTNAVAMRKLYLGDVENAVIDFGGGALGSTGGNCIFAGAQKDVLSEGFAASMQHNWWGLPGEPAADRISQTIPDSINTAHPLAQVPAICAE